MTSRLSITNMIPLLNIICSLLITTAVAEVIQNHRVPKRIMNYVKPPNEYQDTVSYSLCNARGVQGACLSNLECDRHGGRFVGYCQGQNICCVVKDSCGGSTSSHTAMFQNPAFPKNESVARICSYHMKVNRGVCAVRVELPVFELAPYEDGLCIRDTLTILGSKGVAVPVCGNMTNYATTFEVKEFSTVILAMVVQGVPKYRFSIQITQLACNDIISFQSPTHAGIRNDSAASYDPPTTTTTPEPTTTEEPTTTATTLAGEDEMETTTMFIPPNRSNQAGGEEEESSQEDPSQSEKKSTTLRTGSFEKSTKPSDNVREEQPNSDGVYLETISNISPISAFSKAYNSLFKTSEDCKFDYKTKVTDIIEQSNLHQFRIVGGEYTRINEYPWQVALVYKRKFFCGGSLISDRHILTAAHCIFGSFSGGLEHLRVSLGDMDLTTKNETKNIVLKVKKVYWHLNYSPHTTSNDIGLFELETPVTFNYTVSAVKLPTDLDDLYDDVDATVTGWGRYSVTKKATSTIMKDYTGPVTPIKDCVKRWGKFPGIEAREKMHICLGVKSGTPCHGDSGGPLVVCSGPQCTQVGVVSFGFPLCTNVGLPAVFTRVTSYKKWIDNSLTPLLFN